MNPTFDPHVHIWQRQFQQFVVGTGRSGARDQVDLVLHLMDKHGVARACVIAANSDEEPDNDEFVANLCSQHADRFVMMSEIDLSSDRRDALLERTIGDWPACGFRYGVPPDATPEAWSGPDYEKFWSRANEAGLKVAFNIAPNQVQKLSPLVERYERIVWILDHMARPRFDMSEEEYRPVTDLAAFENVYVKVSAFYAFTQDSDEFPYTDLHGFVIRLRDAYGPERLMWASDTPPVLEFGSYGQTYACLRHIAALGPADLEWMLGRTARQLFDGA